MASSFLATAVIMTTAAGPAMAYRNVQVFNNTGYAITGTVNYLSCNPDTFSVGATDGPWTAGGRGAFGWCLVSSVSAVVNVNGSNIVADSFTSTGTGLSVFDVNKNGSQYAVICR